MLDTTSSRLLMIKQLDKRQQCRTINHSTISGANGTAINLVKHPRGNPTRRVVRKPHINDVFGPAGRPKNFKHLPEKRMEGIKNLGLLSNVSSVLLAASASATSPCHPSRAP